MKQFKYKMLPRKFLNW